MTGNSAKVNANTVMEKERYRVQEELSQLQMHVRDTEEWITKLSEVLIPIRGELKPLEMVYEDIPQMEGVSAVGNQVKQIMEMTISVNKALQSLIDDVQL